MSIFRILGATGLCLISCHAAAGNWSYESNEDPMTSKTTHIAMVVSDKSMNFGFPYNGRNFAALSVRSSPRYGTDVYVTVERGQFICDISEGCLIAVRFDDKPFERFRAVTAADHSSNILFIRDTKRFIAAARGGKRIRVAASFFQEGQPIMEFTTPTSLRWPFWK